MNGQQSFSLGYADWVGPRLSFLRFLALQREGAGGWGFSEEGLITLIINYIHHKTMSVLQMVKHRNSINRRSKENRKTNTESANEDFPGS